MSSRSWNRVELIGNLTRDPELRYTPQGTSVCSFGIATNRTYTVDGEKKEEVDFHNIVAWGKLGELCSQLLKKGNKVFVSGRLQNRSWETPEGQTKTRTEIIIEDMIVLTAKSGVVDPSDDFAESIPSKQAEEAPKVEAKTEPKESKPKQESEKEEVNEDDLPF